MRAMATQLTEDEVQRRLAGRPEWSSSDGRTLERTVRLRHRAAAVLVVHVAQVQDELDHHADITLGYDTVHFAITTHCAGDTLTAKDFTLAERIDALITAHEAR